MFFRLLFLLTFIPIVEIYFLIKIGKIFGGTNILILIFATGFLGAWLLRRQGYSILLDLQTSHRHGQQLSEAITRGLLIFVGGLLLLTPGVFTDVIGLSLIFPITQLLWKKFFAKVWQRGLENNHIWIYSNHKKTGSDSRIFSDSRHQSTDSVIIDVEAKTTDKKEE